MVSVPAEATERIGSLDADGMRVLKMSRHGNKLRPGHLRGNRFRILVRDVDAGAGERLEPVLERLRHDGLANFYGTQRFGREGETVQLGLALLRGDKAPINAEGRSPNMRNPFLRKLTLSAAQSALFNLYLARRLADSLMGTVLAGDVMCKWPFGGMFVALDLAREQVRFERREIVHAGPIFGRKTFASSGEAAVREAAIVSDAGLKLAAFHGFGKLLSGTRRHNVVYVGDLAAVSEPEGIRLTFTLPAGSYATVLLREVMKQADIAESEEA
jgi:tRNA pseudouridine13 synthase